MCSDALNAISSKPFPPSLRLKGTATIATLGRRGIEDRVFRFLSGFSDTIAMQYKPTGGQPESYALA